MQSLAELAVKKLPLRQTLEENILSGPFPREVLTNISKKFTLNNLYLEDMLDEDISHDLFYRCLKNIVGTGAIWKSAFVKLGLSLDDWITADITDQSVINQTAAKYNISVNDLTEALKDGVGLILTELINWLDQQGVAFTYGVVTFAFEYQASKKKWKLLIIHRADVDLDNNNIDPSIALLEYNTLDDLLKNIYRYLQIYGDYDPYDNFGSHLKPANLSKQSRKILKAIYYILDEEKEEEVLDEEEILNGNKEEEIILGEEEFSIAEEEVRDIWESLHDRGIILYVHPEFSSNDFEENSKLLRIGDYLYIIQYTGDNNNKVLGEFMYYSEEEALLLLLPLLLETNDNNVWEFLKKGLN